MLVRCAFCSGKGAHPTKYGELCSVCNGAGQVAVSAHIVDCAYCSGKGSHPTKYGEFCPSCNGKGVIDKEKLDPDSSSFSQESYKPHVPEAIEVGKVFIVHGKNHTLRDKIDLYLTKNLGLDTVVMEAGPHGGRTLPEKFEELARSCAFAVFILSADDHLVDKATENDIHRARQNVILEVGFFWGALGRKGKVAFLVESHPDMELPSDIQGIGWIPITNDLAQTKLRLESELRTAGILKRGKGS